MAEWEAGLVEHDDDEWRLTPAGRPYGDAARAGLCLIADDSERAAGEGD